MTENDSIEIINDKVETCEFYFAEHDHYPKWCEYEFLEALGIAITALKEIQQYRAIGTVEECREAREKQKPKNPVKDKYHHNCCPNCGWIVSGECGYGEEFCPHCENCGQAIQWENLEGMEDDKTGIL